MKRIRENKPVSARHDQPRETITMLAILALSTRQIEEGRMQAARDVLQRTRVRSKPR